MQFTQIIIMLILETIGDFTEKDLTSISTALNCPDVNQCKFQLRKFLNLGGRYGPIQKHLRIYSVDDLHEIDGGKRKRKKKKSATKVKKERKPTESEIRKMRAEVARLSRPVAAELRNLDRNGLITMQERKAGKGRPSINPTTVVRRTTSSGRRRVEEYQPRRIKYD